MEPENDKVLIVRYVRSVMRVFQIAGDVMSDVVRSASEQTGPPARPLAHTGYF